MNKEELKEIKKINNNLEEIWHRLDSIQYFIREISDHGILGREIEECIIAIARAQNKELDKKYKEFEKSKDAEV